MKKRKTEINDITKTEEPVLNSIADA